jgi:hypothetical protein
MSMFTFPAATSSVKHSLPSAYARSHHVTVYIYIYIYIYIYPTSFTHQSSLYPRKTMAQEPDQKYTVLSLYWVPVKVLLHATSIYHSPYIPYNEFTVWRRYYKHILPVDNLKWYALVLCADELFIFCSSKQNKDYFSTFVSKSSIFQSTSKQTSSWTTHYIPIYCNQFIQWIVKFIMMLKSLLYLQYTNETTTAAAIPITGCGGLEGCQILRIPYCLDNRLADGSEVVSLTHGPCCFPRNFFFISVFGTHFCHRLSKSHGLWWLEGLGKLIKFS